MSIRLPRATGGPVTERRPLNTMAQLQAGLARVQAAAATRKATQVKLAIKALVPEYQPQLGTV